MMKKLAFVLLAVVSQPAIAQVALSPPTGLTAVWEEGPATTYRPLKLAWMPLISGSSGR